MLKLNEIIELTVDSLAFGGEGVAKYDGIAIFIPDVAPGDVIKAEIISAKKSYAKAKLVEIITPSKDRIKPFCGLANVCGGCQWQHLDYEAQLKAKKQIVQETVKRISGIDTVVKDVLPSDKIKHYRCKVQYPVGQTKVSKRILAGYYKKGTHEIVNVKHCPIQSELIDEITEFVRTRAQELGLTAYNEKKAKGLIRHFVFRESSTTNQVNLIFVINYKKVPDEMVELAEDVMSKFKEVTGVLANFNIGRNNVILGKEFVSICGEDHIIEEIKGVKYKITAGSFFQVNPTSAVKIFDTVKDAIKERVENPTILDVYSGVGSFSYWLNDIAKNVTSIESYPLAVEDAKENKLLNKADNVDIFEGDAQTLLDDFVKEKMTFDVVITDPPRKGCSTESIEAIAALAQKYIVYVSCNPSTLARDLKSLQEKGFTPEFIQPVDMFCHTYHVESIVVLKKV